MNHYPRHIGDYIKDTSHLSLLEHGAYARLLDVYYTREAPIPADQAARLVGARTKEERAAIDSVLAEFFTLENGAWRQKRADEEIAAYLAGEPERESRKTNEALRLQRHRVERAALFAKLHEVGLHADWNIKMSDLRSLVKRHCNGDGNTDPPLHETPPETATATPATANQNQNQNQNHTQSKEKSTAMSGKPDDPVLPGMADPPEKPPPLRTRALEVLAFLNLKTGRDYQPVDANLSLIEARLKEGATVQDCRTVVARKFRDWSADERMRTYLRPATLFNATKFAQYRGECVVEGES